MLFVILHDHRFSGGLILRAGEEVRFPVQEAKESIQDVINGSRLLCDVQQDAIEPLVFGFPHGSERAEQRRQYSNYN